MNRFYLILTATVLLSGCGVENNNQTDISPTKADRDRTLYLPGDKPESGQYPDEFEVKGANLTVVSNLTPDERCRKEALEKALNKFTIDANEACLPGNPTIVELTSEIHTSNTISCTATYTGIIKCKR